MADSHDARQRRAVVLVQEVGHVVLGKDPNVIRQWERNWPGLRRIGVAPGPIDGDAGLGQALELFHEENRPARTGQIRPQDIAGKDHEGDPFREGRIENSAGGIVGRVEQRFPKVVRHFGQSARHGIQAEIARVQKTEGSVGHGWRTRRQSPVYSPAFYPTFRISKTVLFGKTRKKRETGDKVRVEIRKSGCLAVAVRHTIPRPRRPVAPGLLRPPRRVARIWRRFRV